MIKKMVPNLSLIILLLAFMTPQVNSTQTTALSVEAPSIVEPPGKTFLVNITIADVENMKGVAVVLRYNTSVLDAVRVYPTPITEGATKWLPVDENLDFHWDAWPTIDDTYTWNLTDTWTGDDVTTSFNTTKKPVVSDSEMVYVNKTLMTKPANYTINYNTGEITFTTAPGLGLEVSAIYSILIGQVWVSAWNFPTFSGNGKLFMIEFTARENGASSLDFWVNGMGTEVLDNWGDIIECVLIDGNLTVVPEFPEFLIAPLIIVATLTAVLLRKIWLKKRKDTLELSSI